MTGETVRSVVHGEIEAIALSHMSEPHMADLGGQIRPERLLKAHDVGLVIRDESRDLCARVILAEVVADGLDNYPDRWSDDFSVRRVPSIDSVGESPLNEWSEYTKQAFFEPD
jgi:hypothetical protein